MEENYYWLGFSVFPGIGPKRFNKLLDKFGTAMNAWNVKQMQSEEVLGRVLAVKFNEFRKKFNPAEYAFGLNNKNISFLTLADPDYPACLRKLNDPPFVLYFKGDVEIFNKLNNGLIKSDQHSIAVVGTRTITAYGREVTEQITSELVAAGFIIVSGLAFGVDACAHKTTVNMKGKTIAVLGCGVDCCNPRENERLYEDIIDSGGLIVSEIPLSTPPTKGSFPSRNRIIAGLSEAVLVTEGANDSGALYTANNAFKLNRPVFAVPGPITSRLSQGPNSLITKGARLITCAADILNELKVGRMITISKKQNIIKGETEEEALIIDLLNNEHLHFDELVRKTKMNISKLGTCLSIMEIKGILRLNDGLYCLIH